MNVYRKFSDTDILHTVIVTTPRIILASGTNGWRGNTGVSSSLSLYDGIRSRYDVNSLGFATSGLSIFPIDPLDTLSIDRVQYISGSYPATGSIKMVTARSVPIPVGTIETDTDWWERHFNPILGLYDYYSTKKDTYFTGSYDYYCLYLKQNLPYVAPVVSYSGTTSNGLTTVTSSFTMEAWIKPTLVTSSIQDFTIMGQRGRWKFGITGSTGKLLWTDFATVLTSSTPLQPGVWHHVAFTSNGSSGTFYIDLVNNAQVAYTGTLTAFNIAQTGTYLSVGAAFVLSGTINAIKPDQGFCGFLYETKIWSVNRSLSAISGTAATTLLKSGSTNLVHYSRFNDGPFGNAHNFTQGSGAFDYSSTAIHGKFINLRTTLPTSPTWHPNDNIDFTTQKTKINNEVDYFKVIHIPSMFYGRQIATGSVKLVCTSYDNQGIVRILKDDGRGGLYISGSTTRAISGEDYNGVKWNKVGNVFYSEGLIVITDPSLLDFGAVNNDSSHLNDLLQVSFDGLNKIPTKVFQCRIGAGECNGSNNPTFSFLDPNDPDAITDRRYVVKGYNTYITAIGLYDEDRNLVAVAKLAQPIRKREKDNLTIRLRMDF